MPEGDYSRTELVWPGKRTQVERIALPFQVAETVNQSRATREQTPLLAGLPPPPLFEGRYEPDTPWSNKLIWGENKYVLASLLQGDPSIGLEPLAGKVDLIYIDPPFATGQDFSYRARVGDQEWVKEASIIEEVAYRDTWGRGLESYLQMMYDRLVLMRELLADTGSIFVHMGSEISHAIRNILDEVFGSDNFRNDIVLPGRAVKNLQQQFESIARLQIRHDILFWFSKSPSLRLSPHWTEKHDTGNVEGHWHHFWSTADRPTMRYELFGFTPQSGQWVWKKERALKATENYQRYLREAGGRTLAEYWRDTGAALEFVRPSPGDGRPQYWRAPADMRIADSVWSGIPTYSASRDFPTEKNERLLEEILALASQEGDLVADFFSGSGTTIAVAEKLGRRWIGGDLSRYAIQVSRKRLLDIPGCQPFQVLNLGRYERKYWQVHVNGSGLEPEEVIDQYQRFIVALYHAEAVGGYTHLHGQKAGRWVHVGATDAPVTRAEVMEAVRECQANRYTGLDVLGWEWEMGLHDTVREEARRMGVDLRLLVIPREVMDKRAVQAGNVPFYELAYLRTSLLQEGRMVTVRLEDFIIPNPDLVPDAVRGKIKKWSDYIDFWAVDWNYRDDTFHNEWQTYRTRKSPTLRLISDPHTYPEAGDYRILVKVIDIFGNDTTQLIPIAVT